MKPQEGAVSNSIWRLSDDSERLQWVFSPLEHVGPLRFGMTHREAVASVAGELCLAATQGGRGNEVRADFRLDGPKPRAHGTVVTVYYDEEVGLACVAVSARSGPQILMDGLRLVGQVPSLLEQRLTDYTDSHDKDLRYSQRADPCSPQLGLVLRVQRSGDVVVSRPVFVAEKWADRCWDTSEGYIPSREWNTF